MKTEKYIIVFAHDRFLVEHAFSREKAIILAQAKRIDAGLDYTVYSAYKEG